MGRVVFWRKKALDDLWSDDDVRPEGDIVDDRPADIESLPGLDPVGEAALDTVVAILRAFGRHAFEIAGTDMATFRRLCEAWGKHLAVGAPHPETGTGDTIIGRSERDFTGARRFVVKRRQDESEFLARSLGDLREIIADLTERFAATLTQDQEAARSVTEQAERLRAAASNTSIEVLRQEVISVADLLGGLADEHSTRVRGQLAELDLKVASLSEELQELRHESSLDSLTRVFNRGAFDRTFLRLHRVNKMSVQSSSIMLTDLDNLKRINDAYGHQSGDEALRVFADCLVRNFPRRSDFIARYGGDEFVAVLPQTPGPHCARLTRRFMDAVRRLEITRGEGLSFGITASVGMAELKPGESPESWLGRADRALLEAKASGRDRVVIAP
jgi:diguanylate cyclase